METSKAIKILREHKNRMKNVLNDLRPGASARNLVREDIEAFDMAIEALEKQIPKEAEIKPLYFENSKEPVEHLVHCPVCDSPVCFTTEYDVRENYKYCSKCGQKIEWRG